MNHLLLKNSFLCYGELLLMKTVDGDISDKPDNMNVSYAHITRNDEQDITFFWYNCNTI